MRKKNSFTHPNYWFNHIRCIIVVSHRRFTGGGDRPRRYIKQGSSEDSQSITESNTIAVKQRTWLSAQW